MTTARRVLPLVAGAAVLVVGFAWSWGAAIVLAFCLVVAFGVVVGADVGGRWITDASRRRFDDRR